MLVKKYTDPQLAAALSKIPPFSNLSNEHLLTIVKVSELGQYGKGTIICQEGEESLSIYILLSGEVGIFVKNKKIAVRKPIVFLGEMGIFTGWKRSATVIAEKFIIALQISKENLFNLIQTEHEIGILILSTVTQTLSHWLVEKDQILDEYWNLVEKYETTWDDMIDTNDPRLLTEVTSSETGDNGLEQRLRSEIKRIERRLLIIEQRIGALLHELDQSNSIPKQQKLIRERDKTEEDAHILSNLLDQLSKRLAHPEKVPRIKFAEGAVELNMSFNLF